MTKYPLEPITPQQLDEWIRWMGVNKTKAAALIGVTRMTIYSWLEGRHPIPSWLGLVLTALAHGFREYHLPHGPQPIDNALIEIEEPEDDEHVVLAAPGFGSPGA